jgi:hypothetical protein
MGAPGTIVEGAEKPVIRAVVRLMREVVEARRVRKRILAGFYGRVREAWGLLVVG